MSTVQDPAVLVTDDESPLTTMVPFLLRAEAFHQMIDSGILRPEDRVELWDGRIYEKMAKTQAHAASGINVTMALAPVLPRGWCLSTENPVALGPKTTPLPDFAVLRGKGGDYTRRRPAPGDVGLLIELSLSSLKADTGFKLAAYAGANIPVYWVLNLVENLVLVFERPIPSERRYESTQTFTLGQSIPFRLDGVLVTEVAALDLLPDQG